MAACRARALSARPKVSSEAASLGGAQFAHFSHRCPIRGPLAAGAKGGAMVLERRCFMTRSLSTWTPRFPRSLSNLESEFGSMLERMFGPEMESWSELKAWSPRANVAETDKEIEFTVELPGVKPEDVHVELHDGELWISGEMKNETEEKGKTFHKVERRYGEFRRVIPLPASAD